MLLNFSAPPRPVRPVRPPGPPPRPFVLSHPTFVDPFQEFVKGLSVLARGTFDQKLLWAFSLYDVNADGIITKDEMLDIVSAIYDMIGKFPSRPIDEHTPREHVERYSR